MEKVDSVREETLKILIKVFESKSYSNILIKNLGDKYSSLDRAFITEMVYGTIKYKLKIDYIINYLSNIKSNKILPPILNILRLGIYQIEFMDKVPESAAVNESVKLARKYGNPGAVKYVNAVLRNYCRKRENIAYPLKDVDILQYLSISYSFPEWMVERLIDEFGETFTEDFLKSSNTIPGMNIRVNTSKIEIESLKKSLSEKGIEVCDGLYIENSLVLKNVSNLENLEEFKNGYFAVQDESSMLAALLLSPKPGEFIMDVCSAPGTKSTHIAQLMDNKGTVIAGDINNNKLRLVDESAHRLGIDIIHTICSDATTIIDEYRDKADRVLIDVPCSGLGIMRKKPEIRWNREIKDLSEIQSIQKSILIASSKYVKPGGILVYSTCTILRCENKEIIMEFLNNNGNFVLENISDLLPDKLKYKDGKDGFIELYPNVDSIDGFFIARLRRVM